MAATDWLEVGRIGSPFGVKGWVHVESYTDSPGSPAGFPRVGIAWRAARR